jgi:uncharacterized protein
MSSFTDTLAPLFDRAHEEGLVKRSRKSATATATVSATELGQFEAIAATWTLDRSGDQIRRGAFQKTITAWRLADKLVPLRWDHQGEPQYVIGRVDVMRETSDGLLVEGQLDLEQSEVAREAWRAMRTGTIGLSFGFLVTKSHNERDVRVLDEIDLFEISLTPSPVSADTRVLSMKSTGRREPLRIASFDA